MDVTTSLEGLTDLAVSILKLEIEEKNHVFAESMLEYGPGVYSRGFLEAATRIEDLLIAGYGLEEAVMMIARKIPPIEALDVDVHWNDSDVVTISKEEMIAMATVISSFKHLKATSPDLKMAIRVISKKAVDKEWPIFALRYVDYLSRVPDFKSMLVDFCTDLSRTQAEITTLMAHMDKVVQKGDTFQVIRPILRPWRDIGLWDSPKELRGYGTGFEADYEKLAGSVTQKPPDKNRIAPLNVDNALMKFGEDDVPDKRNVYCVRNAPVHGSEFSYLAKHGVPSSIVDPDLMEHIGRNSGQHVVNGMVGDSDFEEEVEVMDVDPNILSDEDQGIEDEMNMLHGLQHSLCSSLLEPKCIANDSILESSLGGKDDVLKDSLSGKDDEFASPLTTIWSKNMSLVNGGDAIKSKALVYGGIQILQKPQDVLLQPVLQPAMMPKDSVIKSSENMYLQPDTSSLYGVRNDTVSLSSPGGSDTIQDDRLAAGNHMKTFLLSEGFDLHGHAKVQDDLVQNNSIHSSVANMGDLANAKTLKQPNAWASKSKKIFQNGGSCGGKLHFVPPNPSLHMKVDLGCVRSKFDTWGWSLLGHYVGYAPNHYMLSNIIRSWGVPARYTLEEGWIIFKFNSEEDMDGVLKKSPYYLYNKPLIIKRMPDYFAFGRAEIATIPVWVRIHGMAKEFWSESLLSEAASYIGTPLFKDQVTELGSKSSYARVMVEVNFSKPITRSITLDYGNGASAQVTFMIENEPIFCIDCLAFGHESTGCTFKDQSKAHKRFTKGSVGAQDQSATDVGGSTKGTAPKDTAGKSGGNPDGVPKVDAPTRDDMKGKIVAAKSVFVKGESSKGAQRKEWRRKSKANGAHRPNRLQIAGMSAPRVVPRVNNKAPRQVVGPNVNNGQGIASEKGLASVAANGRTEAMQNDTQGVVTEGNSGKNSAEFQAESGAVLPSSSNVPDGKELSIVPIGQPGKARIELLVAELLSYSAEERDALATIYASAKKQQGSTQERVLYYSEDGNYDPNDPTEFRKVGNNGKKPKSNLFASFTHGKKGMQQNIGTIPRGKGKGGGNKPS